MQNFVFLPLLKVKKQSKNTKFNSVVKADIVMKVVSVQNNLLTEALLKNLKHQSDDLRRRTFFQSLPQSY